MPLLFATLCGMGLGGGLAMLSAAPQQGPSLSEEHLRAIREELALASIENRTRVSVLEHEVAALKRTLSAMPTTPLR
jgi:hypothetical protein